jgi:hypothetical protein
VTALSVGVILMAVVSWLLLAIERTGRTENTAAPVAAPAGPSTFDATLPLKERIEALEQAVSDERYARQLLQDELFVLTSEIEALTATRAEVTSEPAGRIDFAAPRSASSPAGGAEGRVARLIEAGFAPGQAEWIVQRESQLQMEALQARYDAERAGDAMDFFQNRAAASNALRDELGDADYERYLAARDLPTGVAVSSVLDSSPAERAGLRPGDQIVSYGGERVFNMFDLTRQTLQGQPGEQVAVDILRDGVSMQVIVPRGPIGIYGGRRFSR